MVEFDDLEKFRKVSHTITKLQECEEFLLVNVFNDKISRFARMKRFYQQKCLGSLQEARALL